MDDINQKLFIDDDELLNDGEDIGEENEDDLFGDDEIFEEAVIWGTDWTAETINSQLVRNNIDLFPKFQRRDAWSNKDKSRFIESLILGLPIPQIILAEKKNRGKYMVIDGKQRLLTIRRFFTLNDDDGFKPLRLTGLEVLSELNGCTYKKMQENVKFSSYLNQLENQSIRTVVIKNWGSERFLYTVFLRLNTGSKSLSPQELRQALHPGPFIDYADEFSVESLEIKEMLNLKKPDYRMRDVEIVIRYFSFKYGLETYDGNLKKLFDSTVQKLNESWETDELRIKNDAENLNYSIRFVFEVFGGAKKSFSKWNDDEFQGNFNRAIFDIMVYYFSNPDIRNIAQDKKIEILEGFKYLCSNDPDFLISFEHTTKSIENTSKRLWEWGKKLREILGIDICLPNIGGRDSN